MSSSSSSDKKILVVFILFILGLYSFFYFMPESSFSVTTRYCNKLHYEKVQYSQYIGGMFYCFNYSVDGIGNRSEWFNETLVRGIMQ